MTDRSSELEPELARLRARVEELERERESLGATLSAVAGQIPDNLIVIDRQYRIQFINWTVPELTVEGVLGTDLHAYVPEHLRQRSIEASERAFTTGEHVRFSTEYFGADGSISRWETRIVPLRNGRGEIDRLLQISLNLTERERASADLSRFFQLSVDLLSVATPAGYFKRVSPSFSTALGWSAAELCGATPGIDFVHPEDRSSTLEAIEHLRRGQLTDFENRFLCKEGGHRILEWRAIMDPQTGLIYAAARDVTERRVLEENLRHARKMEAVGRLAGGVAHDFNNLILAISLSAEIARRTGGSASLEDIRMATERAARLTRQLLLFSRKAPIKPRAVDLNLAAADLVRILRYTIPSSIRVDLDLEGETLFVHADPSQLEQVLMNLCLNARDAMPDGGILSIRTERVSGVRSGPDPDGPLGSYAKLTVSDTGTGISPEIRDHIFDPFFTTKAAGAGTGLGLSTVYGIVEQHRGSVAVQSEPGRGACFEIRLPTSDQHDDTPASSREEVVRGGSETLLVADDFDNVRHVVVGLLQAAGYRVLTAVHGNDALARLREQGDEISLALLDVMMPFKTGPEVAALAAKSHPKLRFLFTTGYNDERLSTSRIPEGRLLRKPYAPDDLLRRIRRALDEPASSGPSFSPPSDPDPRRDAAAGLPIERR